MTYEELKQQFLSLRQGSVCPDGLLCLSGVWQCIERCDDDAASAFVFEAIDTVDMFLGRPRCWCVVSHISRAKIVRSGVYAEAEGTVYGGKGKACDLWQQHRKRL